ncbi:hypothetical protein M758_1G304900 [Ceratodon purpureus]|nr:hypothetical protein M758_1G304900 [Ceratodon purpureus]
MAHTRNVKTNLATCRHKQTRADNFNSAAHIHIHKCMSRSPWNLIKLQFHISLRDCLPMFCYFTERNGGEFYHHGIIIIIICRELVFTDGIFVWVPQGRT